MKQSGKIGTAGCNLSFDERERYRRQMQIFDSAEAEKEQLVLKQSAVLVVGVGGLGSVVLPYLAGAGIGKIGIVDNDTVSLSNLQRQVLYETAQINQSKAQLAKKRLQTLNPEIDIEVYNLRFSADNAEEISRPYDLIIDCTDNIATRYIIDQVSASGKKPFVYGSLCEFTGQVSVFNHENGPSYSDVFPHSPDMENLAQPSGILGPVAGIVGSIQAAEAIFVLLRQKSLSGYLLLIDIQNHEFRKIKIGQLDN